jgi:hypothetical protein
MYGKTVTIELDHSDFDLSELLEIFKGLTIASGFEINSWNNVIKDLSAEIHDNEREDLKEKLNEWKTEDEFKHEDLRHSTPKDRLDEWKARNGFGSWTADSEGHEFKEWGDEDDEMIEENDKEDYDGQFKDWANETPIEEEFDEDAAAKRMDIIGQNGNEGTHYQYDWDDNIKGYDYESNDMISNINDSITIIKDRMVDIDLKMDNIDEQLGILNADVANLEIGIAFPPPNEHIIKAKSLYDRTVKVSERDKEWRKDVVDMETGEVSNNGGFDGKSLFTPYKKKPNQKVTEKVMSNEVRLGKWQTDNKTKEVVTLDKTKVRKGKIKDLKK